MPDSGSSIESSGSVERESYYHGLLPKEDVRIILDKNGEFLLRSAEATPGEIRDYVLSVLVNRQLDDTSALKHFIIHSSPQKRYYINYSESFPSIQQLVSHYLKSGAEIQEGVKITAAVRRQFWELDHDSITIQRKLGEGAYGEVSAGTMKFKRGGRTVQVAIKQAKVDKLGKDKIKEFMLEARNMRKLGHPNIIRFYGVAVMQEPIYLVMELAHNGSLDVFLRKNEDIPMDKRYDMLLQIAWGLEYIHGKPMLHRDVAARNCLYGDGKVKISDFGQTRGGTFYQMTPGMKAPVRWLAAETIKSQIFTQKTDVWSYGILAMEIFYNGAEPYPGLTTAEVMEKVQAGYRMTPPPHVHMEIQQMMIKCTADNANDRPTLPDIATILQRVTGTARPDFAAIAKREAAEMLIMNSMTHKRAAKSRGKHKKGSKHSHTKSSSVPKGM